MLSIKKTRSGLIGGTGKTPRHSNSTQSSRRRHFRPFFELDKCRLEVAGDVISGVAVDYVGMNVRASFGETGLNSGRIILIFGRPDPFYA